MNIIFQWIILINNHCQLSKWRSKSDIDLTDVTIGIGGFCPNITY